MNGSNKNMYLKTNQKKKSKCIFSVYIRSNFSLRNSSTLSVFHLRMLSSSAMFPPSSKSFSTGSEPLTYCSGGRREEGEGLLGGQRLPHQWIQLAAQAWMCWTRLRLCHSHLDLKTPEHLWLVTPDKSWGKEANSKATGQSISFSILGTRLCNKWRN